MKLHNDNNYHMLAIAPYRTILFSYETPVAMNIAGTLYVRKKYHKHSSTTLKHLNEYGAKFVEPEYILDEEAWELKMKELLKGASDGNT